MLIIPAIDLRRGHCVRMHEGQYEEERVYYVDPVRMAKLWRIQNARTLHIVDLDAALRRAPGGDPTLDNRALIGEIAATLDIPVQIAGGIRTLEEVESLLSLGVYRVVMGTAAVRTPDLVEEAVRRFGPSRIGVAVDARAGEVYVEGRSEATGRSAADVAVELEARGVRRFVYSDFGREGSLAGPNVEAFRDLGQRLTRAHVTAAGGVAGYRDLLALQALERFRVDSIIVGRALYENRFPCQQFWAWHDLEGVDLDRFSTAPLKAKA
ncbi:MAG TPA: 1-(5-phosphoribosyl)-5-[(5-phosphoribosylamino)methylideneamino] imidazole-4-carboxamide isomerase [Rubricoccaceae bacterium]|nr:1-(5-phosphoribosyl)-5-[(5-phosphoribosylamino)methylideneamino] imidazole-4-carboxamide isomerase [Rubricoccaceae bacterium]